MESIQDAVLGLLSLMPMTGYDLKRMMQTSSIMYWSGNNNQIYKALLALSDEGLVTGETMHQDGAPSKKVYTVTAAGLARLRQLTLTVPDAFEVRKSFLVQLACAWQLKGAEIEALLDAYAKAIQARILMAQQEAAAPPMPRQGAPRETAIWRLVHENIADGYAQELRWIEKAREALTAFPDEKADPNDDEKDENTMQYEVNKHNGQPYLYLAPGGKQIEAEADGMTLLSACMENSTNLLLIDESRLSDSFFTLRTGVAGAILQKFAQYNVRAAVLMDVSQTQGRFREFLQESNRGQVFRSFTDRKAAEDWLTR